MRVPVDFPHRGYSIQSDVVKGKLNGISSIFNDKNVEVARVTYINGIASGACTLYDDNGRIFFQGYLLNGYRHGKGKEFDVEGNVVYEGEFEKGKRKGSFIQMKNLKGYWKELNYKDELVSICHKDIHNQNDGLCYFYKNGKISRISFWKNGKELQLMKEFRDGIMIEYDEGTKCYEGCFRDSIEDNYPREGEGEDYDTDGKSLVYYGYHWNGMRQGKGILYQDGQTVFDGIWFKDRKLSGIIWGSMVLMLLIAVVAFMLSYVAGVALLAVNVLFWSITCILFPYVLYVFYQKFKFLRKLYCQNRKDMIEIKRLNYLIPYILLGILLCIAVAYPLSVQFSKGIAINQCKGQNFGGLFYVDSDSCNGDRYDSFILTTDSKLKSIRIRDNSFNKVATFTVDGLNKLRLIEIGRNSFTMKEVVHNVSRTFHLMNCAKLTSVSIGPGSFSDCSGDFVLKSLPMLSSLQIGDIGINSKNFMYASLLLYDLPALRDIVLGDYSFRYSSRTIFNNLRRLESVKLGNGTLQGDPTFNCSLLISNLPSLTTLLSSGYSFQYYISADIHDLILARTVALPHSFDIVESFSLYNVHNNVRSALLSPLEVTSCSQMYHIGPMVSSIVVLNNSCNSQSFISFYLTNLNNLDSIDIGDDNLMYVDTFQISELSLLSSITIGVGSFTTQKDKLSAVKANPSRTFHVLNCKNLQSIVIGQYSFSDYAGQFELSNLPQLSSLIIGDLSSSSYNFYKASFIIENFPVLSSVSLGADAFGVSVTTRIRNLPNLESITLGSNSLAGENRNDSSTLIMDNLRKLAALYSAGASFRYIRSIKISDVPAVADVSLPGSFFYIISSDIRNIHPSLESIIPTLYSCDYIKALPGSASILELPDRLCNELAYTIFDFSRFTNMKVLKVGNYSFYSVGTFNISGMNELESITIGAGSFTHIREYTSSTVGQTSYSFHLSNCAKLLSLEINAYSFLEYGGPFELSNLPSLTNITIGHVGVTSNNFLMASFVLHDLPQLTYIEMGGSSFISAEKIEMSDLPALTSLYCGNNALSGVSGPDSSLNMSNLPALTTITSDSGTFAYIGIVTLLSSVIMKLVRLSGAFFMVHTKEIHNVSSVLADLVP